MNQPDESSVSEMGEYSVLSWEGPSAAQPCESLMSARRMLVTMLKLLGQAGRSLAGAGDQADR